MRFAGKRDRFILYVWLAILVPYGGICALIYWQENDLSPIYVLGAMWLLLGLLFYFIVESTYYTLWTMKHWFVKPCTFSRRPFQYHRFVDSKKQMDSMLVGR